MFFKKVIKCLLIFPFPESALNEEAARLFMDNYQEYFKYAKLLTELYAQNKERKHTPAPLLLTVRDFILIKKPIRYEICF